MLVRRPLSSWLVSRHAAITCRPSREVMPITTASLGAALPLTSDVDRRTGITACGHVRIAPCELASKGLGAFAAHCMEPPFELGQYKGEILTLADLINRYGAGGVDEQDEFEAANRQAAWLAEREARGVGVTGNYLFNVGKCPHTRRTLLVDAEDHADANWTRYINHSTKRANLVAEREVVADPDGVRGVPIVRFVVSAPIDAGAELLFDYGDGFDVDLMGFEG